MTVPARPRSPLWMVILALAYEEPMHPYRMQVLIKERGKDEIANVAQRNSVYQTIDALARAGLIAVHETERAERRPERTVYAITDAGRRTLRDWLRAVLSTPAREFPDFPAALSLTAMLGPDDTRAQLAARVAALEAKLATLKRPPPGLPRVFLLESEYGAALVRAELKWLRGVVADLGSGRLAWDEELFRRMTGRPAPPPPPETPTRRARPAARPRRRR